MTTGYKIKWTHHALDELEKTVQYLEENWTEKESRKFASKLEEIIFLISQNPLLFPSSKHKNIRKVVVATYNTLYYRVRNDTVEIVSFFSNRQNPKKRKW